MTRFTALAGASLIAIATAASPVLAQDPPKLNAEQSDPVANGIMQGSPPPEDKTIRPTDTDVMEFPTSRWTFNHVRELMPTRSVWAGDKPVYQFPRAERDLDQIPIKTLDGKDITFGDVPALTYADGMLVLHKGQIIYENYWGAGKANQPHLAFSVTKSLIGTLATVLEAQGKLDPAAQVTQYVPELKDSAYGDATVREVMDMLVGVKYSEDYADPEAEVFDYMKAGAAGLRDADYDGANSFYEFLTTLEKEGEHSAGFAYKTVTTEVLAWVVARASGKDVADLLSDEIWSKLGAEEDAYFVIDAVGTESGGGGSNTTLRDLARFGEMIRNKGQFNGQQVIPVEAAEAIFEGGDPAKFAKGGYELLQGWSYSDQWWHTENENGAFMARGIYGQAIYIDPTAEMVVVRYASHPTASNAANDIVSLPAYEALAAELMKQ